jgi:DNA integrity scanning protein DisA with diadenylate cyclase activity
MNGPQTSRLPFTPICTRVKDVNTETLREVVTLAVELAREGREGRKIGTLFTIGDHLAVMERSRPMILDPLFGHPDRVKRINDPDLRETVKELALLDGAFVVSDDGIVVSAGRYLDTPAQGIDLPLGFGSRHVAAAAISNNTRAVALVVSESSVVRAFDDGELISEIIPELWLMSRHQIHLEGEYSQESEDNLTIVTRT